MKLAGKIVKGPNTEIVVIPRGEDDSLIFKCEAVLSYKEFDKMSPEPTPPQKILAGGERIENVEDPTYRSKLLDYSNRRISWMVLKSLAASEIEWDTVKLDDPSTWTNYTDDLQKAGLSDVEINRIINGVMIANCLNDAKIEEARKRFLTSRQPLAENTSTPVDAQPNT